MNLNKVMLAGNLTREVEVSYTPKGTPVAVLGLAVNERWRDGDGTMQERTTFVDCQAWGKTAEALEKHFHKGKAIFIEGRLRQEEWTDKETQKKRRKTLVIVDGWQFVGSGRPEDRTSPRAARPAAQERETSDAGVEGDEIPF